MGFYPAQQFVVSDIRIHHHMGIKPDFRKSPTPRFGFGEIDEVTADSPPLHSRIDRDFVVEKVIRGLNQDNDAAYGFRIRGDKRFITRNYAARNRRASGPAAGSYAARISRKRSSRFGRSLKYRTGGPGGPSFNGNFFAGDR